MVGFRDKKVPFEFPKPVELKMGVGDIFGGKCDKRVGYTLRVGGRGSGIDDRRNWDSYRINGKVVRMSPKEGKKMMGFPDKFEFPVSDATALKQLGNSVAVNAIQATAAKILESLNNYYGKRKK